MNYDEMPAGPDLDRLVAEKVMGWKEDAERWVDKHAIRAWVCAWSPSTEIEDAWKVVEKVTTPSNVR